jgi:hypothetical protein
VIKRTQTARNSQPALRKMCLFLNTVPCSALQRTVFLGRLTREWRSLAKVESPQTLQWTTFQGEACLADLLEGWEILEKYAEDKLGFHQILGNDEPVEVRVWRLRSAHKRALWVKRL